MNKFRHVDESEVLQNLTAQGRSADDYFLLGTPPIICIGGKDGLCALVIEDDAVAHAAERFLAERGARHYTSIEAFQVASGWDGVVRMHEES